MLYKLDDNLIFPDPNKAPADGLLAYGGDLTTDRLLFAYRSGIFPWYNEEPILWWSPNPRFVVFPDKVYVSRSMRKILEKNVFTITVDTAFEQVINNCADIPRAGQPGTWITEEMIEAYCRLFDEGYAHSFEAWKNGELVGGLYGLSMGSIFFGESMFTFASNASKAAFLSMASFVKKMGFSLIDSQVHTPHVETLGGESISRRKYLEILKNGLQQNDVTGSWSELYSSVTSSGTTLATEDPR
ncbi:MAG TPA: leucyl/phenylalanyl-tRNA--protein transferase [Spirochaetota bacterium]|nr:leucyl/phenylalanyl-tRNA--protein transferase [Spirochaetota bacterium]